jgi:DNA-binding CsgD family transcriptional regulator
MELSYITERNWQSSNANPVRASRTATSAAMLMRVLDEIDYGMALVTASGALRYANQLALHELHGEGPLGLGQGHVRARHGNDQSQLQLALADAVRGRRRLINLGQNGGGLSVAVLPMVGGEDDGDDSSESLALMTFGKRQPCETLTVDFFARSQGLTGAEARVLQALCNGAKPKEIATQCAVAISTVRSHICSIRIKTQTANIRELIDRVAILPPITSAMKTARTH